jgi:hypothetical protein
MYYLHSLFHAAFFLRVYGVRDAPKRIMERERKKEPYGVTE